ncbi:TetR/AcrR family transcriptional regulator [Nocardia speluncae]|uniref:TetR/AcrR family transcriptional regulator n=1 Tax=Nocardia speluncae TaxID=419477 RepID=UPI000A7F5949|nr:TetR/AcrR family transcriptional regulator [Nocardia speluncae]
MTGTIEPADPVRVRRVRVTTDAILGAARHAMREHGLDVTVEEIADLAQVGRRTVFRHFATRDDLIRAAIAANFAAYFDAIPAYDGTDWERWLDDLAHRVHRRAAEAGLVIWHLRARRLPPRLAAAYRDHLHALHSLFATTTATLWHAAGGPGAPPDRLRRTVAAHLSPLFTQAVLLDAEGTPEFAAESATAAITAAVHRLRAP